MSTLFSLEATTVAGYRLATNDQTTASSAVSAALLEAESLLEDELRRHLPSQSRTKACKIWPDGRVYPDAWPVDSVVGLVLEDSRTVLGAVPDAGPFVGVIPRNYAPPTVTITWVGGFTAPDGLHPLPVTLAHAIYDLAKAVLAAAPVPVGATSMSVGDVSVSYPSPPQGTVDGYVPGLSDRVRKWANRYIG